MDQIILAIIGSSTLGAIAGGVVSWLLNRKKFVAEVKQLESEVKHTVAQTAALTVTTYQSWVTDLQGRTSELEHRRHRDQERIISLEREVETIKAERREYSARAKMMARVLAVVINLLDGHVTESLWDIATAADISSEDIEWLKNIIDEVGADVDLSVTKDGKPAT